MTFDEVEETRLRGTESHRTRDIANVMGIGCKYGAELWAYWVGSGCDKRKGRARIKLTKKFTKGDRENRCLNDGGDQGYRERKGKIETSARDICKREGAN